MMSEEQQFQLNFEFVQPVDHLVELARKSAASPDADHRIVAMAILDMSAESRKLQQAIARGGDINLEPYFEFRFSDALASAHNTLGATGSGCEIPRSVFTRY